MSVWPYLHFSILLWINPQSVTIPISLCIIGLDDRHIWNLPMKGSPDNSVCPVTWLEWGRDKAATQSRTHAHKCSTVRFDTTGLKAPNPRLHSVVTRITEQRRRAYYFRSDLKTIPAISFGRIVRNKFQIEWVAMLTKYLLSYPAFCLLCTTQWVRQTVSLKSCQWNKLLFCRATPPPPTPTPVFCPAYLYLLVRVWM